MDNNFNGIPSNTDGNVSNLQPNSMYQNPVEPEGVFNNQKIDNDFQQTTDSNMNQGNMNQGNMYQNNMYQENANQNNNYASNNGNAYTTYNNQTNYRKPSNGTGANIKNVIFAILGILANLALITGTFLPTNGKKYFVWTFVKDIIDLIKKKNSYYGMTGKLSFYYMLVINILIVAAFVTICIVALVYLIKFIVALCSNKQSSRLMCNEGGAVLMLTLVQMILLYSAIDKIGASGWLYLIPTYVLIYISAILGFVENRKEAGDNKKAYNVNFIFNLVVLIIVSIIPFFAASNLVNQKYSIKCGFIHGLYALIIDIPISIKYEMTFGGTICVYLITILAMVVVILAAMNVISAISNINKNYEVTGNIFVRAIFSVVFLVAYEVMTIVMKNKYDLDNVKAAPTLLFIIGIICNVLIIITYIIKMVVVNSNPQLNNEVISGKKSKLKGKTIRDFVILICLTIIITGSGITFAVISSNGKDLNSYGSAYDDSDSDDDEDDWSYDDEDEDDWSYDDEDEDDWSYDEDEDEDEDDWF